MITYNETDRIKPLNHTSIYLAGIQQRSRTHSQNGLFVQVYLPDEPGVCAYKSRLEVPANSKPDHESNLAVRWAQQFISASKKTTLYYSLPFPPDEDSHLLNLNLFPRLELESVNRDENEAFRRLFVFVARSQKGY